MKIKTELDVPGTWMAYDEETFFDLAVSDAGFGDTEEEAIQDLLKNMGEID